jgi:hypothetical protein
MIWTQITQDDEEVVSYILNDLDSDYTPLDSSIMSRLEPVSISKLYTQALGFESRHAMLHEIDQQFMTLANSAMRGRGQAGGCSFYGHGRGRGRSTPSQKKDQPRCQIYRKPNHEAVDC